MLSVHPGGAVTTCRACVARSTVMYIHYSCQLSTDCSFPPAGRQVDAAHMKQNRCFIDLCDD